MSDKNKISVYLSEKNVKKLDAQSEKEDLSRSKVLDRILNDHFKQTKR
jgi:metal-responsive CopG/Arc/MetJ family transcriptional regulator